MRRALLVLVLLVIAGGLWAGWQKGWFSGDESASGLGDGANAPDAVGTTSLAAGASKIDPEKDPATYGGDPVGRVDAKAGPAVVTGVVVGTLPSGFLLSTVNVGDGASLPPIRFARVTAILAPPATATVRTTKDGKFEIRGLPVGDVDLRVAADDFWSRTVAVTGLFADVTKDAGQIALKRRPQPSDGLEVKVLDEAGKPIAGAKVTASTLNVGLLLSLGGLAGIPDFVTKESTTDDLGVARFQPLPPDKYDVVVRATGMTVESMQNVVVAAGRVERRSVTLRAGLSFSGTVVDADGNPVANAHLASLLQPSFRNYGMTTTDADGRFTMTGLVAGTYMVFAGHDERGEGNAPAVKTGETAVRIQLGGVGVVKGRVLRADGTPATKFLVRAYTGRFFRYAYSVPRTIEDPEGRFSFPLAPDSYQFDVKAEGSSFTTSKSVTVTKGGTSDVEIKLPAEGVVTGVVTDLDGQHLGGAEVFVTRGGFPPEPVREQYVRADAEGHFALRGLPLEPVKLHARHAGHATTAVEATAVPPDRAKEITIRLNAGSRVVGIVTTRAGTPVQGEQVNASQQFDFFNAKTTITAADGSYSIPALAKGSWTISTGRFENAAQGIRKNVEVSGSGEFRVDFQKEGDEAGTGGEIAGRVTIGGKPVASANVSTEDERGTDAGVSGETDADGRYVLKGVKPGRVRVYAATDSGMIDSESVTVVAGKTATADFAFGTSGLRAKLVGPDGTTVVSGAWVMVEIAERKEGSSSWEGLRAQVNSDQTGMVVATGLEPATYRLRISGSGYAARVTDGFAIGDGETKDLGSIRLAAGGGVSGKVTDDAGRPVEGIGVSAKNARGEDVFLFNIASTGSNGRYEMQGLELGTYSILFEGKGFAPVSRQVTVSAQGASVDATVRRGGSLAARVEDERGQPIEGARIVLFDSAGRRVEKTLSIVSLFDADFTRTGASGVATIPDLAPGAYRATVTKDGMVPTGDGIAFTVESGAQANVTLVVKSLP